MKVDMELDMPAGRKWFCPADEIRGALTIHVAKKTVISAITVSLYGSQPFPKHDP